MLIFLGVIEKEKYEHQQSLDLSFNFPKRVNGSTCNATVIARKWTHITKFKSWLKLFVFHIALIALEKEWIQLFSLQLWVNSWSTERLNFGMANNKGKEEIEKYGP